AACVSRKQMSSPGSFAFDKRLHDARADALRSAGDDGCSVLLIHKVILRLSLEKLYFTGYNRWLIWPRQVAEVNAMSDLSERNAAERKDDLLFVGGHAAIDFINTVHMVGGVLTDTLHSDDDIREWMA